MAAKFTITAEDMENIEGVTDASQLPENVHSALKTNGPCWIGDACARVSDPCRLSLPESRYYDRDRKKANWCVWYLAWLLLAGEYCSAGFISNLPDPRLIDAFD